MCPPILNYANKARVYEPGDRVMDKHEMTAMPAGLGSFQVHSSSFSSFLTFYTAVVEVVSLHFLTDFNRWIWDAGGRFKQIISF